jgi:hypothetical protein
VRRVGTRIDRAHPLGSVVSSACIERWSNWPATRAPRSRPLRSAPRRHASRSGKSDGVPGGAKMHIKRVRQRRKDYENCGGSAQ